MSGEFKSRKFLEIPLNKRWSSMGKTIEEGDRQLLSEEYATRYLESIGSSATRDRVSSVLKSLPMDKALVLNMQAKNTLLMVPGASSTNPTQLFEVQVADKGKNNRNPRRNHKAVSDTPTETKRVLQLRKSLNRMANSAARHAAQSAGQATLSRTGGDQPTLSEAVFTTVEKDGELDGRAGATIAPGDATANNPPKATHGRRVSWATVNTLELLDPLIDIIPRPELTSRAFKKLLRPLAITDDAILLPVGSFRDQVCDFVPGIAEDASGVLQLRFEKFLSSPQCVQLYGLLTHYTYWNVVHPVARRALVAIRELENDYPWRYPSAPSFPLMTQAAHIAHNTAGHPESATDLVSLASGFGSLTGGSEFGSTYTLDTAASLAVQEKEELFLGLQACFSQIRDSVGRSNERHVTLATKALICCAHFSVDALLTLDYPWLEEPDPDQHHQQQQHWQHEEAVNAHGGNGSAASRLRLQLRRLIHQCVADMVDPSRLFTQAYLDAATAHAEEGLAVPVRHNSRSRAEKGQRKQVCIIALCLLTLKPSVPCPLSVPFALHVSISVSILSTPCLPPSLFLLIFRRLFLTN
jgi:hypothetical protein